MWLRQSTASQEILLGPFLDSSDGDTAETALTINNTDIKIWKEGATTLADKNSGGATHVSGGYYYAVLDATDTDTAGKLEVCVHVAGALAVRREYMVVPQAVYDAMVLGTDDLKTDLVDAPNATAVAAIQDGLSTFDPTTQAVTVEAIEEDAIDAEAIAADAVAAVQSGLATASALQVVDDNVDAIKAVTDQLPDSGALTSLATATALQAVDDNVDAILEDTGTTLPSSLSTISGKVDTANSHLTDIKGGGFSGSTDSLEAIRDRGDAAWTTADVSGLAAKTDLPTNFADLSITETTGRVTVGTNADKTDYALTSAYDAAKTAATATDLAAAKTVVDAILVDTGTDGVALSSATMQAIADALLDRASAIDSKTVRQSLRYIAAVLAGKVSGAGTGTETFVGLDGTTERVEVTVDEDGNRSGVEYDPT